MSVQANRAPKVERATIMKRRAVVLGGIAAAALGLGVKHEINAIKHTNESNALTRQLAKPIREVHDDLMSGKISPAKVKVITAPITATPDLEAAAISPDAYDRQGMSEDILAQEGPMVQKGDPLVLPAEQLPKK